MKATSILVSILFAFICDGLSAADASALKLVKPPKAPLQIESRMRLSAPAKRAWDSYEKLYNTFVSIAADSEMLYSKSKSPVMKKNIAGLNDLAKSPSWKNIATTQPFKVKAGEEDLQRKIYKFAEINSDFYSIMYPNMAKAVTTTFNPQPAVPDFTGSTNLETDYNQTVYANRQILQGMESKRERKKFARFAVQQESAIRNEAREKNEEWVNGL